MSDQLSMIFEPLRDARTPQPFAEPEAVRRRGRTLARRQKLGTAAAVLALTGAVAAGTALVLDPPPQPVAGGRTRPQLVAPNDLGPGSWLRADHATVTGGGRLWYWATLCGNPVAVPSLADQRSAESVTFVDGPRRITQTLERYAPGRASVNLADVRATVAACPSPRLGIVAQGFAGDESLLVSVTEPAVDGERREVRYVGVTRVQDQVATVAPIGFNAAYTRTLTERAATRLP